MEAKAVVVNGGRAVRRHPWPKRSTVTRDEVRAVNQVLRLASEDQTTLGRMNGKKTSLFEQAFANYFGTKYASACSSGTAAVHLALMALKLDYGSEVITAPITDVGAVTPLLFQGLVPVFADVDPLTLNVTPDSIEASITSKTKAIIVAHIAGLLCDMDPIMELARKRNIVVIEDCSQAHGAQYKNRLAGSIGDLTTFSLMSGKHITTAGEGGMVLTNVEEYHAEMMRASRSIFLEVGKRRFETHWPVLNYRMTEIQSVFGMAQLKKLQWIVKQRRQLYDYLRKRMSRVKTVRFAKVIPNTRPSYWFAPFFVDLNSITVGLDDYASAIMKEGIPVSARYTGVPLYEYDFFANRRTFGNSQYPWASSAYGKNITYENSCPNAKAALERILTLNIHENCTKQDIDDVVDAFEKVEGHYSK